MLQFLRLATRWYTGALVALALTLGLGAWMVIAHPGTFLPGQTSTGHAQIEGSCASCHTPFSGATQQKCMDCHAYELTEATDSHRAAKFSDPRTLAMLDRIDATQCVTCHGEHEPDRTRAMTVTVPEDFCYECHADIAEERPTHEGLGFDGCASAGCHNFHDNSALYTDFLADHLDEPPLKHPATVPERNMGRIYREHNERAQPLELADHDGGDRSEGEAALTEAWASSAHARSGVNCSDCHRPGRTQWRDEVGMAVCQDCHEAEWDGFTRGRHGMRLAEGLSPMTPQMASLPMRDNPEHEALTCNTCHAAHDYDTGRAAVDACLGCHADEHSRTYRDSPHAGLWEAAQSGEKPATAGVSCATCHMPRVAHDTGDGERMLVKHNQNANLRPNASMAREVCLDCHGMQFSLDSLADEALIEANFAGQPTSHVESLQMVREHLQDEE